LRNVQAAVDDADSVQQAEIASQLKILTTEQSSINNKIRRLKADLQSAVASTQTPSVQPAAVSDSAQTPSRASAPMALVAFAGQTKPPIVLPRQDSSPTSTAALDETLPALRAETDSLPAPLATQGGCYPNAPEIITTKVDDLARAIVGGAPANTNQRVSRYSAAHEDVFFYVVADAVASPSEAQNVRILKAYRYLAETARTDKQVGASARSEGSTTAVEKPGFADLLGWAIEHGAVQQAVNGTTLTLSSSPYALIAAANGGDTAENYREYDFLNRIGVSASFNISDQDSVLSNARRKQLTEWSARIRLSGDRSARSQDFEDFWNRNIRSKVRARLLVLNRAGGLLEDDDNLGASEDGSRESLSDKIEPRILGQIRAILNSADSDEKKTSDIKNAILCNMRQEVFNKIQSGEQQISEATKAKINNDLIPSLFRAHEDLVQARELIKDFLEEAGRKPLMTLAYNNHRTTMGSDYSVLKFLYERNSFKPMKLVANVGVSFYHRPDRTMNQQNVRDFAVGLSFEGKAKSPFMMSELDFSNITYSFSGRYQRTMENRGVAGRKADIAVAQFKVEFPVLAGVSLPFSITYANATELVKEEHVRANFGFSFDASKLFALRKLSQLMAGGQ
jgi:hypothetical protein